jgi:hypothetical protein
MAHEGQQPDRPDIIEAPGGSQAGRVLPEVIDVEGLRQANLAQVVDTGGLPAFGLGPAESRQQHRRQESNHANNHQEFEQGEP